MKPLFAIIGQNGRKDTLRIDELGIEVSGRSTSGIVCREIMEKHPDLGEHSIEVHRSGMLAFTINRVASMAQKTFSEQESGIVLRKWKPFLLA